ARAAPNASGCEPFADGNKRVVRLPWGWWAGRAELGAWGAVWREHAPPAQGTGAVYPGRAQA
ncbi:MAG: hypothetical protein RQ715_10870, partial [Methylococcales bacterium]|nr:hypothetical protein [Methylococcales bacterium]